MTKNEMMLTKSTNKSHATQEVGMVTINVKTWRALLKIAGSQIDTKTAEVCWWYGQIVDPYGVYLDLPGECECVGRLYFARNPGSEVWIEFNDLPDSTRNALWNRPDPKDPAPTEEVPF
jgi:hypothetical protein